MKYFSLTHIGLSVILPNGQSKRISFSPLSVGGSVYYTSDPDEIYGLEHHYRYGSLFRSDPDRPSESVEAPSEGGEADSAPGQLSPEQPATQSAGPEEAVASSGKKEVTVTDLDDAKEYLCRHHGYSRTKLKFKADVLRAAELKNLMLVGL